MEQLVFTLVQDILTWRIPKLVSGFLRQDTLNLRLPVLYHFSFTMVFISYTCIKISLWSVGIRCYISVLITC